MISTAQVFHCAVNDGLWESKQRAVADSQGLFFRGHVVGIAIRWAYVLTEVIVKASHDGEKRLFQQ